MKELIHNYITNHKEEIVYTLKELIKIPSVKQTEEENTPFGKDCRKVLEFINQLYGKNGFETELHNDKGYLLSYFGTGKRTLGLFAHADVVPVGDDWVYTNPFEPVEKEGYLIGRGTIDDKSAVVISLYCAKILKEMDIPFRSRLVCFTGANEESGMQDIKNYITENTPPNFSLVCDSAFPLYRGNKGMLRFTAVTNTPFNSIINVTGSNVYGAVLGRAGVTIQYSDELYEYLKNVKREQINITFYDNKINIDAEGISKHTALAEGSLNAGYLIADILKDCVYISETDRKKMNFISKVLSDSFGKTLGIDNVDPQFGKLTIANDVMELKNGTLNLHFNLRFGAETDIELLKKKLEKEFSKEDFSIVIEDSRPANITDVNHPMIEACLKAYKEFTGENNPEAYINAGGTYAIYLPRAVETGTTMKWGAPRNIKTGHGGAHQPDECINIEGFLEALELTLQMLLECDKTEE